MECLEITRPGAADKLSAALQAGCLYCGRQVGVTFCDPCAKEVSRFMQTKGFGGVFKGKMTLEMRAHMKTLAAEMEQHMKEWVSQREAGGAD